MSFESIILKLTKQLYPTGRAFKMSDGGNFEKLHKGLAKSESRAYSDALSILNSALPDNDNFSTDDATAWERRLGLISNPLVPLNSRKLAIIRKMNHPGELKTRQNYRYLENQLQAAGFGVFVFENRFDDGLGGYTTMAPAEVVTDASTQHGDMQHGDSQHGSLVTTVIANSIDESIDNVFDVGVNLRSTFFIGGTPLGTFVELDKNREDEFRQLVLRIKPVQTIGYLFINYV